MAKKLRKMLGICVFIQTVFIESDQNTPLKGKNITPSLAKTKF